MCWGRVDRPLGEHSKAARDGLITFRLEAWSHLQNCIKLWNKWDHPPPHPQDSHDNHNPHPTFKQPIPTPIWVTWHTKFCNMSRTFKTTNQVYKLTWYLSVTSFYNFIATSYGKLYKVKKFWLNILTHKSRWIGSWLCNLFFMNERLLNAFSSLTNPNTWTIAIFANLLYLLNFSIKNGSKIDLHPQFGNWIQIWTFNHYPLNIMSLKHDDFTSNICESRRP